jgi:hypothetical protein
MRSYTLQSQEKEAILSMPWSFHTEGTTNVSRFTTKHGAEKTHSVRFYWGLKNKPQENTAKFTQTKSHVTGVLAMLQAEVLSHSGKRDLHSGDNRFEFLPRRREGRGFSQSLQSNAGISPWKRLWSLRHSVVYTISVQICIVWVEDLRLSWGGGGEVSRPGLLGYETWTYG